MFTSQRADNFFSASGGKQEQESAMSCAADVPFYKHSPLSSYNEPAGGIVVLMVLGAVIAIVVCLVIRYARARPCAASALAARRSGGGGATPGKAVAATSPQHLEELVSVPTRTFCMFHAPWCGHCRLALPEFEMAATLVPSCTFVTVDCENVMDAPAMKKHDVTHFPLFVVYERGNRVHVHEGGRTKDAFADTARKQVAKRDEQ